MNKSLLILTVAIASQPLCAKQLTLPQSNQFTSKEKVSTTPEVHSTSNGTPLAAIQDVETTQIFNSPINAAKRTKAISELKMLYISCLQYAQKHDSAFPKSLEELANAGDKKRINDQITIDYPNNGTKAKYVTGLTLSSPANSILLYSDADSEGNVIVAKTNGSVVTIPKAQFEKDLKAQQQK